MSPKQSKPLTVLILLMLAALACNLTNQNIPSITPTPANLPSVAIITPVDGATVQAGQQVDIRAVVSDTGGGVTAVELRVDGEVISRYASSEGPQIYETVQQTWVPETPGVHTLEVIAYRSSVASEPDSITLNVEGQSGPQIPAGCTATVTAPAGLRVRSGPGTRYEHLYSLPNGTTVPIVGRTGDNDWWQVRASDGLVGWVSAEYTDPSGDCRAIPVVQPPSLPTQERDTTISGINLQLANIEGPTEATRVGGSVTTTFVVTVRNTGDTAPDSLFNLTFYPQGRTGSTPQTITIAPIQPGKSISLIFSGTYHAPGNYIAEAVVDSGQTVAETNETDNSQAFNIRIF